MTKNCVNRTAGLIGAFFLAAASCLFTACPQGAEDTGPDKSALTAKIAEAEANRDSVEVSITGDGNDVEVGAKWVTIPAKNEYNLAIASAKKVQYDNKATQGQINQAVADIDAATAVFDPLKKDGLNPNYNVRALRLAIYNANNLLGDSPASASGIEYTPEQYWALTADRTEYQAVITQAVSVAGDITANQSDIDIATYTLNAATARFNTLRKIGIKPDKTALAAAITAATANLNSTEVSADGTDLVSVKQWVVQAVKDAYTGAITAAQAVNGAAVTDVTVLQPQVDEAKAVLDAATAVFNAAKRAGSRDVNTLPNPLVTGVTITAAGTGTALADSKTQVLVTFDEEIAIPEGGIPAAGWGIAGSESATALINNTIDATNKVLILTLNGKPSIDEVAGLTLSYASADGAVVHKYNAQKKLLDVSPRPITVTGFDPALDTRPVFTGARIDGDRELYWSESVKSGVPNYYAAAASRGKYARMLYLTFDANVRIDTEFYYAFTVNNLPQGYRINRITKASNGTNSGHGQAADSANLQFASPAIILYLNDTLTNAQAAAITVSYDITRGNLRDVNDNKVASFTNQPVTIGNYPTDAEIQQNFRLPHADILDVVLNNTKNAYNAAVYPAPVTPAEAALAVLNNGGANKRPNTIYNRYDPNGEMSYYRWRWDGPGTDAFFTLPYRDDAALKAKLDDDDGFSFEAVFCNGAAGVAMGNASAKLRKTGGDFQWVVKIDNTEVVVPAGFTGKGTWDAYHIVGTWDKAARTLNIYANGELKNSTTVTGAGEFTHPAADGQWFAFNGEASAASYQGAISNPNGGGELTLGRIYGRALTADDAAGLFEDVRRGTLSPYNASSPTSPNWP
jgi:hypothetical protein